MRAVAFASIVFASMLVALAVPATASAQTQGRQMMQAAKVVGVAITSPWLRATPNGAPVAGGYAIIKNVGGQPDRLIGASLPMAPKAEVHTMSMANGVMHMQKLDDGLVIAPGQTVTLEPSGFHLMFMHPSAQLKEGESVNGTLIFAKAGAIPVTFAVGGMAAKSAPGVANGTGGHHTKDMPGMDMH